MTLFLTIIGATFLQSLISFSGALLSIFRQERIKGIAHVIISFAVGALLGVSLFDLLPEALEMGGVEFTLLAKFVFVGILAFFILEKFFIWYHCHDEDCRKQSYAHLIIWGDVLHNFIDGAIIALTFLVDIRLGLITTLAVSLHEIPQEISDFGILIHSGMRRERAILYNFLASLSTIAGAILMFFLGIALAEYLPYALALAAGNFIYIAVADLIPELHEKSSFKHAITQTLVICLGALVVILPDLLILN